MVFREENFLVFKTHFINFVKLCFGVYHLGVAQLKNSKGRVEKAKFKGTIVF